MPEVVRAVDVLYVQDLLRNGIDEYSRLYFGIQTLKDERGLRLQLVQVADRMRKDVEGYIQHRGRYHCRDCHDWPQHAGAADAARSKRYDFTIARQSAQPHQGSYQK